MIPLGVRLLAIVASGAYLIAILMALRSSRMSIRQSLLWLLSGVVFLGVSLVPGPFMWLAEAVGFTAPSNSVFVSWLLVLTILIFYQSLTTSRQALQLKTLCQEIALLRLRPEAGEADVDGILPGKRGTN